MEDAADDATRIHACRPYAAARYEAVSHPNDTARQWPRIEAFLTALGTVAGLTRSRPRGAARSRPRLGVLTFLGSGDRRSARKQRQRPARDSLASASRAAGLRKHRLAPVIVRIRVLVASTRALDSRVPENHAERCSASVGNHMKRVVVADRWTFHQQCEVARLVTGLQSRRGGDQCSIMCVM